MKRRFRCSGLPLLLACAHSQDQADLLIEAYEAHGPSDLGTAVHDAMRSVVDGRQVDVALFALRHGVDAKELGPLVWYGRQAWKELAPSFPRPESEVEVEYEHLTFDLVGHIDLLSLVEEHARFIDWKSGRKEETDYYGQLAGYALCLILGHGCKSVTASVVWLRSQTIETYTFTREDVMEFVGKVAAHLAGGERYRHGEHCAHCVRSHACPALLAISRRDVAIFSAADIESAIAEASPQELVSLRRRSKVVEAFAATLDTAIRRRVTEGGPLDSGDGYDLALVEENGKREIDTLKAWPVLRERLDDEELAGCITISAKDADDAVAKKAGRGKGAAAKRALAAELEAAGAVKQGRVLKLKEVRRALPAKEIGHGE